MYNESSQAKVMSVLFVYLLVDSPFCTCFLEHSPPHPGNDKKDPPKTKIRYNSKEDKQDKYRYLLYLS